MLMGQLGTLPDAFTESQVKRKSSQTLILAEPLSLVLEMLSESQRMRTESSVLPLSELISHSRRKDQLLITMYVYLNHP